MQKVRSKDLLIPILMITIIAAIVMTWSNIDTTKPGQHITEEESESQVKFNTVDSLPDERASSCANEGLEDYNNESKKNEKPEY